MYGGREKERERDDVVMCVSHVFLTSKLFLCLFFSVIFFLISFETHCTHIRFNLFSIIRSAESVARAGVIACND